MTVQDENFELPSMSDLEQLLLRLTVPDTNVIRSATTLLRSILPHFGCIELLCQVLAASENVSARQLAAVYLRKKIGAHWIRLKTGERSSVQSMLLQQLINEPVRVVKIGIAGVVTVVARYTLPTNEWPELIPFLERMVAPSSPIHEISLRIFRVLAQNSMKALRPYMSKLLIIFSSGLNAADIAVRLEALKAMGTLTQILDTDEAMQWFQTSLGPMVTAMKQCVEAGYSDAAIVSLEVLEELAENPNDVIGNQLAPLLATVLGLARATDVEMDVRDRAGCLITTVLQRRPLQVAAIPDVVNEILNASLHLMIEGCAIDPSIHNEDEADEQVEGARAIAVQVLDSAMLNIPVTITYQHTINSVVELSRSQSSVHRRAGLYALMVMTEGCCDAMRSNFDDLLALVLKGLADEEPAVRESACLAVGQFADHLSDLMEQTHLIGKVLDAIFHCLDRAEQSLTVKRKLCLSLESLCSEIGDSMKPYLAPLVQRLFALIHSADEALQQSAISALATTATAAEVLFLPFFNDTLSLMSSALNQSAEEHLCLRAKATYCIGCASAAVGAEHLPQSMVVTLMEQSVQGFALDSCELRENTFGFWALLARVLGQQFEPYLGTVVDSAVKSIDSFDGMQVRSGNVDFDAEFGGGGSPEDEDEDDISIGDEDDDDDDDSPVQCSILSGYLDEKVAAVDCLGTCMKFAGRASGVHIERAVTTLEKLCDYPHHYVRGTVIRALVQCVEAVNVMFPGAPVSAQTTALIDRVVPALHVLMIDDDTRDISSAATDAVLHLIKKVDSSFLQMHLSDIMQSSAQLLANKAQCQQFDQDSARDAVTESVCDLIGGIAQALNTKFAPAFATVMPLLGKRFSASGDDEFGQSMILGCLGEVIESIKEGAAPFASGIATITIASIKPNASHRLRRNAAYCLGALFSSLPAQATAQHHANAFAAISANLALAVPDASSASNARELAARDNEVSALCKLVRCTGGEGFDMQAVLSVLLANIPLHHDMQENEFVYPVLLESFRLSPSPLAMPRMVAVLSAALLDQRVDKSVQASIANGLRALLHSAQATDLSQLSAEQRSCVQQIMQG